MYEFTYLYLLPRYIYINPLYWISKKFLKAKKRGESNNLSAVGKLAAIAFSKSSSRKGRKVRGGEFVLLSGILSSCELSWCKNLAVVNGILVFKDIHFSYNMTSLHDSYFI